MPPPSVPEAQCAKKEEKQEGGGFLELVQTSPRDLWLIFLLKVLWGLAEFSLAAVLVLFLSDDLKMDDTSAGWVFGWLGFAKAVYGIGCGLAVDKLGIRFSCLGGSFMLTFGLVVVAMSESSWIVISALLTVKAFGSALLLNPMIFAIRYYTTPRTRPFAFSFFYVAMNGSAFAASLLVNAARNSHKMGPMPWDSAIAGISLWRMCIWVSVVCGALTFVVAFLLTDPVRQTESEEDRLRGSQSAASPAPGTWSLVKVTMREAKFWRLVALSLIFVGVRLIFVHLSATFPKYFMRKMGANAPFELVIAVNPMTIILCVPVFTWVVERWVKAEMKNVLLLGAFITALSPLPLVYETSYLTAVAFVFILSVGEALWSPKFYEYSVGVSPVGREGTYAALSSAPLFASTLVAGGFSGHLLTEYCPSSRDCDGQPIWLLVCLLTMISPIVLLFCRSCLFVKEDLVQEEPRLQDDAQYYGGTESGSGRRRPAASSA